MALSLAQKFINLGMPSPLAVEFANQLNTGVYNWKRLMWNSMVPDLARYVADSLAAGTFDPRIAMEKTMSEAVATLTAGGGVPTPFPAPSGYAWEYVFEGADPVYEGGERVVELVRIAA